jgi:hypothetical protein
VALTGPITSSQQESGVGVGAEVGSLTLPVDAILRVGRSGSVLMMGKVGDTVLGDLVGDKRSVMKSITFSVDIILRVVRVRRIVTVVRTGKVVVPVDVDLVGSS